MVKYVRCRGVWKYVGQAAVPKERDAEVYLQLGSMPKGAWKLVCFSSDKWMYYDLGGELSKLPRRVSPQVETGNGQHGKG